MTDPLYVFDLRGVYVFRWDCNDALPLRIKSHYNASADRFELPTKNLMNDLKATIEDIIVVDDPDEFKVAFREEPPEDLIEAAVLVEHAPLTTTVLLPTPDAVDRGIEAGGSRVTD